MKRVVSLCLLLPLGLLAAPAIASPEAPAAALGAPGPWRSIGPEGYVNDLTALRFPDPQDPAYVLALAAHQLWASRDGGRSWRSLTDGVPFSGRIRGLEIDPFDRDHLYLYTWGLVEGEPRLIESRDAGRTWSSRLAPSNYRVYNLRFNDQVRNQVAIAGFLDLHLSRDGGQTWEELPPIPAPVQVAPSLLAAHRGKFYYVLSRQLWTFDPELRVWHKVSDLPQGFTVLQADLTRPDAFFARYLGDLYRSTDGGASFTLILAGGAALGFYQSPVNPSQLAAFDGRNLRLSLDRGASWVAEPADLLNLFRAAAAFDPGSGDLLFHLDEQLVRRRPDGSRQAFRPRGLYAMALAAVYLDAPRGDLYAASLDGALFRRPAGGRWSPIGDADCAAQNIAVTPWDPSRVFVTCPFGYQASTDGGAHFTYTSLSGGDTQIPTQILFGPGSPGSTWALSVTGSLASIEPPANAIGFPISAVAHPEAGILATLGLSPSASLAEWQPATGWTSLGPFNVDDYAHLGQDPADPDHLVALGNLGSVQVSFDRGRTWPVRSAAQPPGQQFSAGNQALIDPNDPSHLLLAGDGGLSESVDGAVTWQYPLPLRYTLAAAFGPSSDLYLADLDGLELRQAAFAPCADSSDNFCARQDRFELTVEWKTPSGETGVARKVATGSQESGLFYFFDADNWELLVKVLDGCGINQRFWVFTAGTTDVEYALKVEDRWTGRIRTYWNAPGQAAPATTDIDAFATCGEPAPAGAAAAPPVLTAADAMAEGGGALQLVGGRFEVTANYTDFAGHTGAATPAPLVSPNSGLFWFFSPDNWEVLIKVLDGCAINGHYWVLAAATTDVGYELRVAEPSRQREKVYRNQLGRASPAQIDLEAFSCGN